MNALKKSLRLELYSAWAYRNNCVLNKHHYYYTINTYTTLGVPLKNTTRGKPSKISGLN